jgi:hypothetical protein
VLFRSKKAGRKLIKPGLEDAIKKKSLEGALSCALCFIVADECQVEPREVGYALDLMEIPISKCQLGLFGNSPMGKIVRKAESIPEELEKAIREMLENGRLPCHCSWQLAKQFAMPKIKVSSACEAMGIKISVCQLGAF